MLLDMLLWLQFGVCIILNKFGELPVLAAATAVGVAIGYAIGRG